MKGNHRASLPSPPERPTRVRHLVVLVTFLAAFLLYLHRFCMSYAQQYIKEDLQLSDDQIAYCFSAFFLSYALAQVPSGWLSDRFGARRTLTMYILAWSAFTALMGLTMGFVMLLVCRLAAGLGQAGAYPTSAGLLSKWVPFSSRGRASSCVAFGGRLGGGLAPVLTATLIVALVPLSVSARLEPDDLLDVYYLCFRLSAASEESRPSDTHKETAEAAAKTRVSRRIFSLLSDEAKQSVIELAPVYPRAFQKLAQRDERKSIKRDLKKYDPDVEQALETPPLETIDTLVDALNAILMREDLYRAADFGEMAVEAEAKRLATRPADGLSPLELERLNRLLLEAAFPNCIKKLYVAGWRPVMFIYGSLGLLVAGLFWFCFRDSPSLHSRCNAAEVTLIGYRHSSNEADRQKRPRAVPIKHIVKSRSLWLMCITQWGSNVGWVFLVTWLPRYLLEVHSIPLEQRGWMAAAPLFVGWSGMLLGGWLTDRVTHQLGLRWGRALPIASGRFLAMSAYLACLLHPSPWLMTAAFAVVAFSTDIGSASIWSYKQDVGGRDVGSIHGWANMWGNLGATISPILLRTVEANFGWDAAFGVCATSFFIAGIAALGIDASIPIVPPDEDRDEA